MPVHQNIEHTQQERILCKKAVGLPMNNFYKVCIDTNKTCFEQLYLHSSLNALMYAKRSIYFGKETVEMPSIVRNRVFGCCEQSLQGSISQRGLSGGGKL